MHYIMIILITLCSFNSEGTMHRKGYSKVRIGMRSDIAIKFLGRSIVPDKALTEEGIKCYYAYIDGKKSDLEFTYKNYHLIRIECWDRTISFENKVKIGDEVEKLREAYNEIIKVKPHPYLGKKWQNYYFDLEETRVIFEVNADTIYSYRVGKIPEVEDPEGCMSK